jgi:hypothetical protein
MASDDEIVAEVADVLEVTMAFCRAKDIGLDERRSRAA